VSSAPWIAHERELNFQRMLQILSRNCETCSKLRIRFKATSYGQKLPEASQTSTILVSLITSIPA
jgi:hypothetical protein